jgi:ADP-dependent phosphofructokinase/glucokinase
MYSMSLNLVEQRFELFEEPPYLPPSPNNNNTKKKKKKEQNQIDIKEEISWILDFVQAIKIIFRVRSNIVFSSVEWEYLGLCSSGL